MFTGCVTLEQINLKRKELIAAGQDIAQVNAAYNRAKKSIIESRPTFRRPPKFTATPAQPKEYAPFNLKRGEVPKNTIRITADAIYV